MKTTTMKVEAFDMLELSAREYTSEGFMKAPAALARTGVQLYRAREFPPLVEAGTDPNQIIRLYRPPSEVFAPDSMASFEGVPVILEPHKTVTADNWRDVAVGDVHGITQNGQLLGAKHIIIRDSSAVDAVKEGKKFLSNGYTFDLDLTPGTTPEGEGYDGVQRNIRGNHVAITGAPRGGPACRIADSNEGAKKMKKVTINGVTVEVGDAEAGYIETLQTDLAAARNVQPAIKAGDTELVGADAIVKHIAAKDAEIAELKSKVLTEAQVEERVQARVSTIGDAVKLVPGFKADSKDCLTIHKEVLEKVTGSDANLKTIVGTILQGKAIGDADPTLVQIAFKTAAVSKVSSQTAADAALADTLLGGNNVEAKDQKPSGREMFIARQNEAWKK